MTERIKSRLKNSQNGFSLLSCYAHPWRERSSEIGEGLEFFSVVIKRSQLRWFRHLMRKSPGACQRLWGWCKVFANAMSIFFPSNSIQSMQDCSLVSPHLSSPIPCEVTKLFCFPSTLVLHSTYFPSLLKSPMKESYGSFLPPPFPSFFSILQCVSVRGKITIRLLSSVNHSNSRGRGGEEEDKWVNDLWWRRHCS